LTTRYIDIEDGQLVPKSLTAYPSDTVIFRMSGRSDVVTVDFGTSSPFGSQPSDLKFDLDGTNTLYSSSAQKTVSASTTHQYFYNVNHVPPPGAEPEPTTTLPGDITVSTEAPPKDKL